MRAVDGGEQAAEGGARRARQQRGGRAPVGCEAARVRVEQGSLEFVRVVCAGRVIGSLGTCVSVPFVSARDDAGSRFRALESSSHASPLPGSIQPSPEANLGCDTQGRIGTSSSVLVRGLWISGPSCLWSVNDTPIMSFVAHS